MKSKQTKNKITMEKKQTAVDLLVSILNKDGFAPVLTDEEIQQALQLEREQIVNAFSEGTRMKDINDELSAKFNACVYYADTFNDE